MKNHSVKTNHRSLKKQKKSLYKKLIRLALFIGLGAYGIYWVFQPPFSKNDPQISQALKNIKDTKQRENIWKIVSDTAENDFRRFQGCSCPNIHGETLQNFACTRIEWLAEISSDVFESALSSAQGITQEQDWQSVYPDVILSIVKLPPERKEEVLAKAAQLTKGENCDYEVYCDLLRALGRIPISHWNRVIQTLEDARKVKKMSAHGQFEMINRLLEKLQID